MTEWTHFPKLPNFRQPAYWACPECTIALYKGSFDQLGDSYTEEDLATPANAIARADQINVTLGLFGDPTKDPTRPTLEEVPAEVECGVCGEAAVAA